MAFGDVAGLLGVAVGQRGHQRLVVVQRMVLVLGEHRQKVRRHDADGLADLRHQPPRMRGSMNLSIKDGGLPPDSVVQDEETILADSERVLKLFHDPKPGAMVRVALAPCSPLAVPWRVLEGSAELAERYDARLHCHLCQSPDEDVYAMQAFGKRSRPVHT